MQTEVIDPDRIQPLHEPDDTDKVADLTAAMTADGWTGAPVIVIDGVDRGWGAGDPQAITGSHRIAAARAAGIDIPTVNFRDVLVEYGFTLAQLDEEYGVDPDDDTHYEAVRRLDEHLPAEAVEYYGLDAH
jgi:ParB-like chromosome segregation protein Spo0J